MQTLLITLQSKYGTPCVSHYKFSDHQLPTHSKSKYFKKNHNKILSRGITNQVLSTEHSEVGPGVKSKTLMWHFIVHPTA